MAFSSSQHHSFDILTAKLYGMQEAVLIHHFQHWIRVNRYAGRNIREGRCWTYQTRKEIQAHFPYWTFDEVRRLCERLVEMGVLVKNNFNKSKIDKTLWYAFSNEKAFGVDEESSNMFYERQSCPSKGKSAPSKGKSATPIPDNKPYNRTEDKREREEGAKPPTPQASPPPPPSFSSGKVRMQREEHQKLVEDFGSEAVAQKVQRLNEYAKENPGKFKQYGCHATVLRRWISEDASKTPEKKALSNKEDPTENERKNRSLGIKIEKAFYEHTRSREFIVTGGGVEFKRRDGGYDVLSYIDIGFRETVLNNLRKMGLPIQGL